MQIFTPFATMIKTIDYFNKIKSWTDKFGLRRQVVVKCSRASFLWKWLEVAAMGLWHGAQAPSGLSEGEGNSLHCCLQPPLCPLLGGKQPLRSDIFCKWFHKKMVRTKIPGNSFCCNPLALAIRPFTIVELHFRGMHIVYFITDAEWMALAIDWNWNVW